MGKRGTSIPRPEERAEVFWEESKSFGEILYFKNKATTIWDRKTEKTNKIFKEIKAPIRISAFIKRYFYLSKKKVDWNHVFLSSEFTNNMIF